MNVYDSLLHILIKCLFALGPVSVNIPFDYDQEHLNTKIYIDRHVYCLYNNNNNCNNNNNNIDN